MTKRRKPSPVIISLRVTDCQFEQIISVLESDDEEPQEIAEILKAQRAAQLGAVHEVVNSTCVQCETKLFVPIDFLQNSFVEGSVRYFCPFCDFECKNVRCEPCHKKHIEEEVSGCP